MEFIKSFIKNVKRLGVNVDSIVVEQNGKVEEKVFNDIKLHEIRSCGKVLIAMAYGIAMDDKMICKRGGQLGLNERVYPTFESLVASLPEEAKNWTVKTLLTHSTGYEKMMLKASQVESLDKLKLLDIFFETPIKFETNTHFTYNNFEPYLLSVFFKENFDVDISDFIFERIFKPLEIKNYIWKKYGKYCAAATGLYLNYKDFHKIGKLLLDFGKYNGRRVVSESWIKEMTKPQIACPDYYKPERLLPKLGAGYFTWISRDEIVFRDGADGQFLICDYKKNRLISILSTQKEMSSVMECLKGVI